MNQGEKPDHRLSPKHTNNWLTNQYPGFWYAAFSSSMEPAFNGDSLGDVTHIGDFGNSIFWRIRFVSPCEMPQNMQKKTGMTADRNLKVIPVRK